MLAIRNILYFLFLILIAFIEQDKELAFFAFFTIIVAKKWVEV